MSHEPSDATQGRLTTAAAHAASKPGLYGDGGTLYLRVGKTGSKAWVQRVMINGRRSEMGLGGFPLVPLAKARAQARANRSAIREGRNPLAETRLARAQSAARLKGTLLDIADCVNDTCPWSGEPVQANALTKFAGLVVGFCNPDCRDKFDRAIRHFHDAAARAGR